MERKYDLPTSTKLHHYMNVLVMKDEARMVESRSDLEVFSLEDYHIAVTAVWFRPGAELESRYICTAIGREEDIERFEEEVLVA